ncbi:MAG: fibronectin type III domain-containing protein [Planctomycetota bacterium]
MAKIKLGLNRLSVSDKIMLADAIVTKMTGNPNFTTPVPALVDITAKKTATITAQNTAEVKRLDSKGATEDLADAAKELDLILTQAALYVENVSGGDVAKILSAGMSVKDAGAPVGQLLPPTDLSATAGNNDGEIDLNWEPVRGARSYVIHITTDPNVPDSWEPKTNATESFAAITGLTSGQKYWFKVAGIGAAGQGPFSDPCAKYAP